MAKWGEEGKRRQILEEKKFRVQRKSKTKLLFQLDLTETADWVVAEYINIIKNKIMLVGLVASVL